MLHAKELSCVLVTTLILQWTQPAWAVDNEAPRVLHQVVSEAALGQSVDLSVQLVDKSDIFEPKLHFRQVGDFEFTSIDLSKGKGNEWYGTIPFSFVTRDLEYFFEAFDINGNGPGRHGSPEKPHHLKVRSAVSAARQVTPATTVSAAPAAVNPIGTTTTGTVVTVAAETPIYQKWWFWTLIGVGVAAVAVPLTLCATKTGICTGGASALPTDFTLQFTGPDLRGAQ
jgi:hypothetical protein